MTAPDLERTQTTIPDDNTLPSGGWQTSAGIHSWRKLEKLQGWSTENNPLFNVRRSEELMSQDGVVEREYVNVGGKLKTLLLIIFCSLEPGGGGSQLLRVFLRVPLTIDVLQLFLGDPKAFPGLTRYIIQSLLQTAPVLPGGPGLKEPTEPRPLVRHRDAILRFPKEW